MAINKSRPTITYENVAVFQSEHLSYGSGSNSGQNLSFLPLVQGIDFSFDTPRINSSALGSKNLIDQSNFVAPNVRFSIKATEDFGELFSNFIEDGEFSGSQNFKTSRNFYAVINDKKGFDISGENLYLKNTIGVGNCFLNNVTIEQSVNGILSSKYDFVGSNLQVKNLDYKTIYFQDYESLPLGDLANNPNTAPIEQLHDSLGILTVTEEGGGQDSIVVTDSPLGMPGTKSLKITDGGTATFFDHRISGFPVDTDYIISGTYRNENFSNPGKFRVQFVNDGAINEVFTGDSTVASAFVGSGRLKPTDSEIRLKFPGVSDTDQQAVYISDITIKAVTGFQITAPSLDLTGDYQPQDMVANFEPMSNYYSNSSSKIVTYKDTMISISGEYSTGVFLVKPDILSSFTMNLPITRKAIYSMGKKFPVNRKPIYPNLGILSFSSIVSEFETENTSSLKDYLSGDQYYQINISGRNHQFSLEITRAKLDTTNYSQQVGKATSNFAFSFDVDNVERINYLNNRDSMLLYLDRQNLRCVPTTGDSVFDLATLPTPFAYPNNTGSLNFLYSQGGGDLTGQVKLNKDAFVFEDATINSQANILAIDDDRAGSSGPDSAQSKLLESFTMLAWIKPDSLNGGNQALMRQRNGNEEGPGLHLNNNKIRYQSFFSKKFDGTRVTFERETSPISEMSADKFQQITLTYSHSTGSIGVDNSDFESFIKIYHNGNLVDTINENFIRQDPGYGAKFHLGGAHRTSVQSRYDAGATPRYNQYKGQIALAAIYDKVLTKAEIEDNYNRIRGRFGLKLDDPRDQYVVNFDFLGNTYATAGSTVNNKTSWEATDSQGAIYTIAWDNSKWVNSISALPFYSATVNADDTIYPWIDANGNLLSSFSNFVYSS